MPVIQDEEFGKITIRRSARATQVRVRIGPDGMLRASLPLYAPIFLVKRLLKSSRSELRLMFAQAQPDETYSDGLRIGKTPYLNRPAELDQASEGDAPSPTNYRPAPERPNAE